MENIKSLDCTPSSAMKAVIANFSSGISTFRQGTKNRFFRPIFRRKIGFRPAPRRKIRGKIDHRKNRGKIGKIADFSPKNRKKPIFPSKNPDCGARALVQEFLKKYR